MPASARVPFIIRIFAIVLGLVGLGLLGGGIYLIALGGSWYYALAGVGLAYSAWRCWRGDITGIWVYLGVFVLTVVLSILLPIFDLQAGLN